MDLLALVVFVALVAVSVWLWRWADRTNRTAGAASRSEDMDPHRQYGG